MQTMHYCLENGVQVTLVHQPDARQAAALWCVDTGSLLEPDAWPGLAHLLEHMLFRGSERFPDTERLMSWVPAQGGRLNASTRLTQTAYFFEVPAGQLEAGLQRLTDMLIAPRLDADEILSEVAVIDAEYRLLQQDAEKRREAALLQAMDSDGRLARFRIGSRALFGEEAAPLHQALHAFHQQHYHAGAMQLWLQGPQPLATLDALARQHAALLPPAKECAPLHLPPLHHHHLALQQTGETVLSLSFCLPIATRGALRPLETLLLDETPGGLMATLRQHNLVTAIALQADRLDAATLWLRFSFTLSDATVSAAQVEALFFRWLQAVGTLDGEQHAALLDFSRLAFAQLSPMDALRARAFGLPPPAPKSWQALLAALNPHNLTRLWASPAIAGECCDSQGFSLQLAPFPTPPAQETPEAHFTPFPPPAPLALPTLPPLSAPLAWQPADGEPSLRLRPAPATRFSDEEAWILVARLLPLSARAARLGGKLTLQREQGLWQLHLRGDALFLQAMLDAINQHLRAPQENAVMQGRLALAREQTLEMQGSAVRRLLTQLPRVLHSAVTHASQHGWQAQLTGGSAELHAALSRLLSEFIFPLVGATATPALPSPGQHYFLPVEDAENALLLFVPVDESNTAAIQALVQRCQPLFFHHMRVERNLGYVAECHWYRGADTQGVLVVLQSPDNSPEVLFAEVQRFFDDLALSDAQPATQWLAQQLPDAWRGASRNSLPAH